MPADRLFHPRLNHSEKIGKLSHLEFRVWHTYVLAADDYGVVRKSATTFQAASDALDQEPKEVIQAALAKLVTVGLCAVFEHQGRKYLCQLDWQNFQRVKHPRDSSNPLPTAQLVANATPSTQRLWEQHNSLREEVLDVPVSGSPLGGEREPDGSRMGGEREASGSRVGNEREPNGKSTSGEREPIGSLARARAREMANGYRLTANGLKEEKKASPFQMDVWARELVDLYPPARRCSPLVVERPLFEVLTADPNIAPETAWEALKARLEVNKRSHEWRIKGMAPRLDRYLISGAHLQELEEHPVATLVNEKTARTLSSGAAFVAGGGHGTR
jgi:hypothetical protein